MKHSSLAVDSPNQLRTNEYRCVCGKLLAKLRPQVIEVKCPRCKRIYLIPFTIQSEKEKAINRPGSTGVRDKN